MVGSTEGPSGEELECPMTEKHDGFVKRRPKALPPCASRVNLPGF